MTAEPTVRPSAIAGTWYPGTAPALRATVEGYLDAVTPVQLPGRLMALVAPHAGYAYSGGVAAHAYALLRAAASGAAASGATASGATASGAAASGAAASGATASGAAASGAAPVRFERVVLLGPLHRLIHGSPLGAFMAPSEDAYRTPLGEVPLDRTFLDALGARVPVTLVRRDEEHSLEIQLPFLQAALDRFALAPIMVGFSLEERGAAAYVDALADALAALADDRTLLVASTDLSHMHDYGEVVATDRRLTALVDAFDVDGLVAGLQQGRINACGGAGLAAVLRACQRRGALGARVLQYAASGDVTGDRRPGTYTVGYLAAGVYGH